MNGTTQPEDAKAELAMANSHTQQNPESPIIRIVNWELRPVDEKPAVLTPATGLAKLGDALKNCAALPVAC